MVVNLPSVKAVLAKMSNTPQKEAANILCNEGVPPTHSLVKKLLPYTLAMKCIRASSTKIKRVLFKRNVPGGERVKSALAKKVGVGRNRIFGASKKKADKKARQTRQLKSLRMTCTVVKFLKRDDNSYCLPGKNDVRKYALSDTMQNLHKKFLLENPDSTISRATFCRMRPKEMKTIQWSQRRQCLCLIHANMALLLQAVKNLPKSTTEIQKMTDKDLEEKLQAINTPTVVFK